MPSHATIPPATTAPPVSGRNIVGRNVEEVVSAKDEENGNANAKKKAPTTPRKRKSLGWGHKKKGVRKVKGGGTKKALASATPKKRGRPRKSEAPPPSAPKAKEEPEEEDEPNDEMERKRKRDERSTDDPEEEEDPSSAADPSSSAKEAASSSPTSSSPPKKRARKRAPGNRKRELNWNNRFEELRAFREEHGHCNVPTEGGNNKLGNWVSRQREQYRAREKSTDNTATGLDSDRIQKLESIGFKWRLPPGYPKKEKPNEEECEKLREEKKAAAEAAEDAKWKEMFFQLVLYKAEKGTCMVPIVYAGHKSLGAWVGNQRHKYRQRHLGEKSSSGSGGGTTLTPDRIKALEAIDFSWGVHEDRWEKRFAELVAFKEKHGHCVVPTAKGEALGRWVNQQRMSRAVLVTGEKKSKGCAMTPERYERLDALGFTWRLKDRTTWDVRFGELIEFKKEFGHCIVPQHFAQNRPLGKWVTKQRYERSKMLKGQHSAMTEERIEALDSLGFAWSATSRRSSGDDGVPRVGPDEYGTGHDDVGEEYREEYGHQEEASHHHQEEEASHHHHHQGEASNHHQEEEGSHHHQEEEASHHHHHQEEASHHHQEEDASRHHQEEASHHHPDEASHHHHRHQEEASAEYSADDYPAAARPAERVASNDPPGVQQRNAFMAEHIGMG